MLTDSILLGSLHTYRRYIARYLLHKDPEQKDPRLPIYYQALAGVGAGWTNSLATTPVELLKTKLQMQTQRVTLRHASGTATSGLAAEVFWLVAYPADVIKNRLMADSLQHPQYPGFKGMSKVAKDLWTPSHQSPRELGLLGLPFRVRRIYTGYLTCALRAFPTNAGALLAFETAMYFMNVK
ncbi:hypothetical protein MPSI1_000527 [Malassezia psittaci]|uniref:Uncharacterized protein n=1 Tax=Malassezia psittaci TaxID=1821823 RepID=A0AAF0F327_9BASI|nr:hypothetical protein MPSI1_000527 [Malassezia psittaci]